MLGELALGDVDLAAPAERRARRRPNRCRRRACAPPPGAACRRRKRPRLPDGVKTTSVGHGLRIATAVDPVAARAAAAPRPAARGSVARRPSAWRLAERLEPAPAVAVVAHQHVGAHDRGHLLGVQRVHDRRGHAGADRHGEEGGVEGVPVGQAEADVGGAAGGVDLELLAQPPDQAERRAAGLAERADRHDQRIDHDVGARDAVVGGALDDLLRDLEAHVRVLGDAGLVVRDRDHRGAVLLDQRQHRLEPLVLAGHRVDQRLALVDREPGLERLDDRGVDRQRHVGQRLHQLDRLGQDLGLVGERDAGIDVEHVGAGRDLGQRIGLDGRLKSPAAISAASLLRPVGLIRSPMMQNGRSKPITTSLLAELTTVSVIRALPRRRVDGRCSHQRPQTLLRIIGIDAWPQRHRPRPRDRRRTSPATTRRHSPR